MVIFKANDFCNYPIFVIDPLNIHLSTSSVPKIILDTIPASTKPGPGPQKETNNIPESILGTAFSDLANKHFGPPPNLTEDNLHVQT